MRKMTTFCAIFFAFLICAGLISCQHDMVNLPDSEQVYFELPMWPPIVYKTDAENEAEVESEAETETSNPLQISSPYPELSRWQITVTCGEFQEQFFATETLFAFTIKKNEPFCVSAKPITLTTDGQETSFFMPCGAIYPYDWNTENPIQLTWEGGFESYIFETLFNSKKETGVTTKHMIQFLKSFNWQKFGNSLREKQTDAESKSENNFYNPWLLDTYQLMDNLSYGTFKASFLNMKNITSLSISKLEPYSQENLLCQYIPENKNLWKTGQIYVKKGRLQYFSCNTDFAVIILYSSSKKMSLDYVFMPIFKEEI